MKKLFTLLAIATGFAVMAPAASQARDNHSSRSFSHSCRTCSAPVYRERVYVGRDRFGRPIYDWRTAPHRHDFSRGRGHDHHDHNHGRAPSRGPGIFIPLPGFGR